MGLDFHLVSRLAQPAGVWAQLKGSLDVGDPFLSGKVPYWAQPPGKCRLRSCMTRQGREEGEDRTIMELSSETAGPVQT